MANDNYISEAEAIDEWWDCNPTEIRAEIVYMLANPPPARLMAKLKQRLNAAKEAKVGATVTCPACGEGFEKTTYHKTFCSNYKTHGKNNCKDRYHNAMKELT